MAVLKNMSKNVELMLAITWGWSEKQIQALLEKGADPHFENEKGVSPLALVFSKINTAKTEMEKKQYKAIEQILLKFNEHVVKQKSKPKAK